MCVSVCAHALVCVCVCVCVSTGTHVVCVCVYLSVGGPDCIWNTSAPCICSSYQHFTVDVEDQKFALFSKISRNYRSMQITWDKIADCLERFVKDRDLAMEIRRKFCQVDDSKLVSIHSQYIVWYTWFCFT